MRGIIIIVTTIFISIFCHAQRNLSGSTKGSHKIQVFKITQKQAQELFRSGMEKMSEKYLNNFVIEINKEDDDPVLPFGNYIFVSGKKNRLLTKLVTVGDIHYKVLNNNHDFIVLVHKPNGDIISDAEVKINNRRIPFNKDLQAYLLKKFNKDGLVKIKTGGALFAFLAEKNNRQSNWNSVAFNRYFFRNLSYKFPIKYILYPVRKIRNKIKYSSAKNNQSYERRFSNVFVLNKPLFKPNDTLKLKAFVQTKKGKQHNKPLFIRLGNYNANIDTVLGVIHPYRPGGYEYSFVLNEGLGLTLDKNYILYLQEDTSATNDKIVAQQSFKYEDYELKSIMFNARVDKEKHTRGMGNALYLRAVDENNLAVMDGRVEITITPVKFGSIDFKAPKVFIPDVLWQHKQSLDPLGETKIEIHDSIFPEASLKYNVKCKFLNANNELQEKELTSEFLAEREQIFFKKLQDSLFIDYRVGGKPATIPAQVYALNNNDDTVEQKNLLLPATIKINPFAIEYNVETDSLYEYFDIDQEKGIVSCNAMRTKDSIYVQLINPHKLKVWYTIFQKNRIIEYGYGEELFYKAKTRTPGNYFVSLQYIYADEPHNEEFTVPYRNKLLNVLVDQPKNIYPGQKVTITVDVKDVGGKPVQDADVTAYAFTKKFTNSNAPFVPYFGKQYPGRKKMNVSKQSDDVVETETELKMNWQRWGKELNLDTIEYYKFLHPKGVYVNREPAKDSLTQIAPFVVINGELQPIHQIYIDEKPVFFSQANHLQRYSFNVLPGVHSLKLRTHNSMIKVDSIYAAMFMKTFLSFDIAEPLPYVHVEKFMKNKKPLQELSEHEMNLWSRYMILVNNFYKDNFSYVRQNNDVFLLGRTSNFEKPVLTGPLVNTPSDFIVKNNFTQRFDVEGSYIYNISEGLIKQRQLEKPLFTKALSATEPEFNFKDMVLTENEIDSLWLDFINDKVESEEYYHYQTGSTAQVRIGIKNDKMLQVKNILLFRENDADFLRVYKGSSTDLGSMVPDKYSLMLLFRNNDYIIYTGMQPMPGGLNYYLINTDAVKKADSMSLRIFEALQNRFQTYNLKRQEDNLNTIKSSFNQQFMDNATFTQTVSGVVKDNKGTPLAGVAITIKNTGYGAITNSDGHFVLKIPKSGTLIFSYVGFTTTEEKLVPNKYYDIVLLPASYSLDEVVVTALGIQRQRRSLGYSSTSITSNELAGRVAGMNITGNAGASTTIRIRGANTTYNFNNEPLIIIDGIPVAKSMMDHLTAEDIENISVLKDAAAIAIYGTRAANGVIIITSKKGALAKNDAFTELISAANSLRTNFKDDAFWQPKLLTDVNGRASFTTIFPEDITAWKTHFIAMGNNKTSGYADGEINSFKNFTGNLALPQFMVANDTLNVIGKILNYQMDSIVVSRMFYVDDKLFSEKNLSLKNSLIDTFTVTNLRNDSLKLKYTVQKEAGNFDGEERLIPVYPQGVKETKGIFAALRKDTSFVFTPMPDTASVKIYAESSLLPVLKDEAEKIRRYEYLCNEQLASKIKALLVQKRIDSISKQQFSHEKELKKMIGLLNKNRHGSGLWGWWANNEPMIWISRHAIEALLQAEAQGYSINLNKQQLIDFLIFNLETYRRTDKLNTINLLYQLNAKADYKKHIDSLDAYYKRLKVADVKISLYEQLQVLELKQKLGFDIDLAKILALKQETVFGNYYWGEEGYRFFDNSIQNSLLMYKLFKGKNGSEDIAERIRGYFFEKRKDGNWRNTYESSLILETILPDLITDGNLPEPPQLSVITNKLYTTNQYPFTITINSGQNISITKKGKHPVYFTAYQQYWNQAPKKYSNNFIVNSYFEKGKDIVSVLKGGEPVTLKAEVEVKADADYILIEIPIPAGCSYNDKSQGWSHNEVHREYFKNKVSIFCSSLKKGHYTFSVSLVPRYTGSYHLNPTKAEMMYFPVFYGREEMKKVRVE